jgi:hypothetical protein
MDTSGAGALCAALLAITPRAAEVAAVFEMNCRREMRFFIVIPPNLERPAHIELLFLIEYARC